MNTPVARAQEPPLPARPIRAKRSTSAAAVRDWCRERQSDLLGTIRSLVERESPSHQKPAVDRLAEWLAGEFEALEGRSRLYKAQDYGNHLQVDFGGGSGSPVLLLGHYDTVWEIGTLEQMPLRIADGRVFGPGVFDMKAGIALLMYAIAGLRDVAGGLPRPVTVLLVSDEEVGSQSSRGVTESLAREAAAVLVAEPAYGPAGALKTARKGVGEYTVRVTGKAAHAGLDFEKGASAILELARQIVAISRLTDRKRGLTLNPGVIRGGTRTNVIAAEATAQIDVRIARAADGAQIDRKLRALKPFNKRCELELSGGINRPPLERTPAIAALFKQAREIARSLGKPLKEVAVGGGSDGNFTAGLGIPTLDGLGAIGDGAHATHEHIVIEALPWRAALLAGLIEAV